MVKNSRNMIMAIVAIIILDMVSFIMDIDLMYLLTLNIWLVSFLYTVSDLKRHILYCVFLIAFGTFLLGGHFCYEYFSMEIAHYCGDEYYFHSNFLMGISLSFVLFAYYFNSHTRLRFKRSDGKNKQEYRVHNTGYVLKIQKITKILFIMFFIFWIYELLDTVAFVAANSYSSYYTEYESNASFTVRALAAMTPYFFYLFLATFPAKRECRLPIVLYLFYAVISVFTGKRGNFVFMFLFIILYFVLRHYENREEQWIKKRYVIVGICFIPVCSIMMYVYSFIRMGDSVSEISLVEMFLRFFQSQGISSSVIRLEKYYENELRADTLYSFYGTLKYLRTNSIIQLVYRPQYGFSYVHHSVALATKGNSLDAAISYLTLHHYLAGAGMGSCYIAELFHDFSYMGVVFGNMIYGAIMSVIGKTWNKFSNHNIWVTALCFAMVEAFIKAPRWNFDIIVSYFFDLGMWISFALVFCLSKFIQNKSYKNENRI